MAAQNFRVIFTESAWSDLEEIAAYWAQREEPERGEQYARDLPSEAVRLLSERSTAQAGRYLRHTAYPRTQELPAFKHAYRILYLVKENDALSKCCASGTATATNHFTTDNRDG